MHSTPALPRRFKSSNGEGAGAPRAARYLTAAVMLVAVAGCANMRGIAPESSMRSPDSVEAGASVRALSQHAAAWPQDAWWTRYGDPQLTALVQEALAGSPNLRAAHARVRQAAAVAGVAEAARSPQVGAGLKDTRQEFSANYLIPKPLAGNWYWVNDASLTFSYELDFWGKNGAAVEAAVGRVKASEADAYAARLLLTVGLAQNYLRLDQLYAQRDLAQETLVQREKILALTSQRVAAELDSKVDLRQAQMAIPVAREQIAATDETIALVKAQIAAMVGQGPDRGLVINRPRMALPPGFGVPDTLSSDLLARRPDIVALRWRVEAVSQDIKVAKAQFYPSINLSALIGLQSLGFSKLLETGSHTLAATSGISLPLFDGGRLRSNLAGRSAEYDIAVEQYNQGVIDAVRDVVSQLTSLKWLDERIVQQDLALQAADDAFRLAQQRYQSGLGNYLQVLIAESQVIAQKRARIDLGARALDLDLNLTRALGGGYEGAAPIRQASLK